VAAHVAQSIGFKLHLKKDQLARQGIFRLGYWKHTTSGYVVYGIRMMLHDMDLERTDLSADANLDHISIQALKPFAVNAQRAYHERTESALAECQPVIRHREISTQESHHSVQGRFNLIASDHRR
jgi:hypothetical protein